MTTAALSPLTEARRRQQGLDNPDSCPSARLRRSSDGHDITRTGCQNLSGCHCDTPGVSFVLSRESYPNLGCSVKISIFRSCLSLSIRLSHGSSPNSELIDREKQPILERVKTFNSRNSCRLEDHSRIINLISSSLNQ